MDSVFSEIKAFKRPNKKARFFQIICTAFYSKDVGKLPLVSPDNPFVQILSMTVSSVMSRWSISENGKLKRGSTKKPLSAEK